MIPKNRSTNSCRTSEILLKNIAHLNRNIDTLIHKVVIVCVVIEIQTVDNDLYGIKMKMIDFPNPGKQNSILGTTDTTSKDHSTKNLLSTNLNENGYPTALETDTNLFELFGTSNTVNHLFTESIYNESGYFEFDSCQNFATLYNDNKELTSKL